MRTKVRICGLIGPSGNVGNVGNVENVENIGNVGNVKKHYDVRSIRQSDLVGECQPDQGHAGVPPHGLGHPENI